MANEYTPTVWKTGDVITAEKLNKIEEGIAGAGGGTSDLKFASVEIVNETSLAYNVTNYIVKDGEIDVEKVPVPSSDEHVTIQVPLNAQIENCALAYLEIRSQVTGATVGKELTCADGYIDYIALTNKRWLVCLEGEVETTAIITISNT